MTPATLDLLMESNIEEERRKRRVRANEICALVYGQRHKSPSLQKIYHSLTGDKGKANMQGLEEMIAESHARVPEALRAQQLQDQLELNRDN